ncbi:MAG TPA: MFS transporter, partial [Anaerolinea sp.]|nr:MFS transporter [Anaerolinea sp.]
MPRKPLLEFPADISPRLRSNIIHYYFDIGWWGLYAGATAAFLSIYAARIGATPAQIGLLTALPSGISLALSLPFASIVRRLGAHRATWTAALVARSMFLLYALLPFFFTQPEQVNAILIIGALMAVPNTLIGISFSQLLMDAVTPDWRGTVVGVRNAFFSIITFVVTMISGQILTRVAFPLGYQVIFVIGFIGGIATAYHLYKVRPLRATPAPEAGSPPASAQPRRLPRYLPPLDPPGRRYLRVLGILFLFNITNNMLAPLVPGVLVNHLALTDEWISIGTAVNNLIVFLISLNIARLTRPTGNRAATALGSALLAAQALALALAAGPAGYMLSVAAGGLGSGVLITAQFNYHLDNVPETDRSAWLSWSLLMGNTALLLGSLLGPLLAGGIGVLWALAVFAALRLV